MTSPFTNPADPSSQISSSKGIGRYHTASPAVKRAMRRSLLLEAATAYFFPDVAAAGGGDLGATLERMRAARDRAEEVLPEMARAADEAIAVPEPQRTAAQWAAIDRCEAHLLAARQSAVEMMVLRELAAPGGLASECSEVLAKACEDLH